MEYGTHVDSRQGIAMEKARAGAELTRLKEQEQEIVEDYITRGFNPNCIHYQGLCNNNLSESCFNDGARCGLAQELNFDEQVASLNHVPGSGVHEMGHWWNRKTYGVAAARTIARNERDRKKYENSRGGKK